MSVDSPYPICRDVSDVKPFFSKKDLFLKPLVRINVSVQLPKIKTKEYTISNHHLMEAIKEFARPDEFCSIKSTENSVDLIRFEAEVEQPKNVKWILSRIDGQLIQLKDRSGTAKARASIAKNNFPTRHEWDSFFRDAKHMNELKAGERPDTIHIQDLPKEWFSTKTSEGNPSEKLLCRMFEQFGAISAIDVPSNDSYRSRMKDHISGRRQFNFVKTDLFEVYIQFKDYLSFVAAMDELRGMKLLKKDGDKAWTQVIKVDFDKTKHLSESSIRKRKLLREKLMSQERQKEEKCDEVVDNMVHSKITSGTSAKETRASQPEASRSAVSSEVSLKKILREEKLLLAAQRKLESIRLLSQLLERVSDKKNVSSHSGSEKRSKKKSSVWSNNQSLDKRPAAEVEDQELPMRTSLKHQDQSFNRQGQHCRGKAFPFGYRRGRGRFKRGANYYRGRWEGRHNYNRLGYNHYSRDSSADENFFNRYDSTVHSLYYKYFESLARDKTEDINTESNSRSRSPSESPKRRSRSHSHSRRKERIKSRSRSRSRRRSKSHSQSRQRSRIVPRSRRRSRTLSRSRRRSRTDSQSRRRNRSRHTKSRSRSCHHSRSRSHSHHRSRSQNRSRPRMTSDSCSHR